MSIKGPTRDRAEIRSWANSKAIVAVEMRPHRVDSEPAYMALLARSTAEATDRARIIAWDDFFAQFDLLGLAVVYDEKTMYNELLQVEAESAYVPAAYRTTAPD